MLRRHAPQERRVPSELFGAAMYCLIGHRWWRGWRSSPPHIAEPRRRRGPSPSPRARSFAVAHPASAWFQVESKRMKRRPAGSPGLPQRPKRPAPAFRSAVPSVSASSRLNWCSSSAIRTRRDSGLLPYSGRARSALAFFWSRRSRSPFTRVEVGFVVDAVACSAWLADRHALDVCQKTRGEFADRAL